MKILLVGNGGRENAIAWKIANSKSFIETDSVLYNTLGSPGINEFAKPVEIRPDDIELLKEFSLKERIDFTIVGPEVPLAMGIVNEFEKEGLKIFGPKKEAAEIESSKVFAKNLMRQNKIPTAEYRTFDAGNLKPANDYFMNCSYPVVIKADGLAAGKGVFIAADRHEAERVIVQFFEGKLFGKAGGNFIIEDYLAGEEISVFAITDGENFVTLPFSQDHKKILEGDKGNNTGGMGAVAPVNKFMHRELKAKIDEKIINPVLSSLRNSGREFKGCLYCGLMIADDEPYVIEFNCRFGDPETQAVLPLIASDFLELLIASADSKKEKLKEYELIVNDYYACCVVLASAGYPGEYETGKKISGLDKIYGNVKTFHSGTRYDCENRAEIFSNGGRVLSVVGISEISLKEAVNNSYEAVSAIRFDGMYYRKDIGYRQI